ncbi:MAG: AraC family transcriptional regulator [Candidatus Accumulibacter sp.]|jgi:AraC-like DNA-binding protein|nr:AraC family transcriptional regulator [Accumulibacter sp.]
MYPSGNELFFHIARHAGLEFVFTSGNALRYPTHLHISVHTITFVRRGAVRLYRQEAVNTHRAGSVYVVAPYEPHRPEFSDDVDIVSLCVDKRHFQNMNHFELDDLITCHAIRLMNDKLLSEAEIQSFLDGIEGIRRRENSAAPVERTCPDALLSSRDIDRSSFGFIRYFKGKTGLTPHQYVIQKRLREAKRMIAGRIPIADAAGLAGFYDQSHLNRWFNKTLGITPHRYRNSCFFLDAR